jgi:hypothetical protein
MAKKYVCTGCKKPIESGYVVVEQVLGDERREPLMFHAGDRPCDIIQQQTDLNSCLNVYLFQRVGDSVFADVVPFADLEKKL